MLDLTVIEDGRIIGLFHDWIQKAPPNKSVGTALGATSCPLAMFLREATDYALTVRVTHSSIWVGDEHYHLKRPLGRFVNLIDNYAVKYANNNVTRELALTALRVAQTQSSNFDTLESELSYAE